MPIYRAQPVVEFKKSLKSTSGVCIFKDVDCILILERSIKTNGEMRYGSG